MPCQFRFFQATRSNIVISMISLKTELTDLFKCFGGYRRPQVFMVTSTRRYFCHISDKYSIILHLTYVCANQLIITSFLNADQKYSGTNITKHLDITLHYHDIFCTGRELQSVSSAITKQICMQLIDCNIQLLCSSATSCGPT